MKYLYLVITSLLLFVGFGAIAQNKKTLDHNAYKEWRRTDSEQISNDGKWVTYTLVANAEANDILKLAKSDGEEVIHYERGADGKFSDNSQFLFYTVSPDIDSLKDLRRKKTSKDDLPGDTLVIYTLSSGKTRKIGGLKSYKIPQKWNGWFAYQAVTPEDSTAKMKKELSLVIEQFDGSGKYEFPNVKDYRFSEKGGRIAFVSEGTDSTNMPGVYVFDASTGQTSPLFRSKGKYHSLTWSENGKRLAFVSDTDTTKVLIRPYELHLWSAGEDSTRTIATGNDEALIGDWLISESYRNMFSRDESKLFFGIKPYPVLQDTSLLDEEIVNVEVWNYKDTRLHTQQKIEKDNDLKKAYTSVYHIGSGKTVRLGGKELPDIIPGDEGNSRYHLGYNNEPYLTTISWEGFPLNHDVYVVDDQTGERRLAARKVNASPSLSPSARYITWYSNSDSAWFAYNISSSELNRITDNNTVKFYNELSDTPSNPYSYGVTGWTENDDQVLLYDRYDIWAVDPDGKEKPYRITPNGRADNLTYRYLRLDDEERFIRKGQEMLLRAFNENDKSSALYAMKFRSKRSPRKLYEGDYRFAMIEKAQKGDRILFTQENFRTFPDLLTTDLTFRNVKKISDANPQQDDYKWGDVALYSWEAFDGKKLQGLLVKPDDFDPNKKYPLLVNFYERSSDRLNYHIDPYPHRSTINYSLYTSKGYVIFNPDVVYETGEPGESAYNCVISGVESLIKEGFIDKDRIGAQGHSWGGYQVAYLVTKTDIFKCAESGAPVPNMVSAYGGIRWWSGLSRMFQYEHTQSRIGGTLWEYRDRYIENSPIFYLDKVNTPLLIMHNDADGHVPWYQGIELFVGLRRLGKPAWFLNYQGEPHWPLKLQNRIDFSIRMQQFFDHYLLDAPMPRWMKEGVPAVRMGIDQALDRN